MPTWIEYINHLSSLTNDADVSRFLNTELFKILDRIATRRNRNVLLYGSAFLQKPQAPPFLISITPEDINGVMSALNGMDWSKGLTLVLHTPGGVMPAAETIVDYLHQKFSDIEVIVPTYAMSAGTMIALASNRIVMGRQSQLGQIDPQMIINNSQYVPAGAIIDQFNLAKSEVLSDQKLAHVWAPILQSLGPSLLQEAKNVISYGQTIVAAWLQKRMFSSVKDDNTRKKQADKVVKYFSMTADINNHGRRINRDEACAQGIVIEELELNQQFQDEVLSLYHLMTILFEKGPAAKFMASSTHKMWVKNVFAPPSIQPQKK